MYLKPIHLLTGTNNGLSVGINVENYEYMKSTRGGSGIKILVHDPNEFPLVADLGQAVGTGTHAFIPVQMIKVHNEECCYFVVLLLSF